MLYLSLGFVAAIALCVLMLKLIFRDNPEKIMAKHSEEQNSVLIKKYPEAEVENFRSSFLGIGVIGALCFCLVAFNVQSPLVAEEPIDYSPANIDPVIYVPPTVQPKPKTLPAPEVVEKKKKFSHKLEIVEDTKEILKQEVEDLPDEPEIDAPIVVPEPVAAADPEPIVDEPDPVEEPIHIIVEEMPEFPGGEKELMKFIYSQIKYPPIARENGIEGLVAISFVIDKKGEVSDYKILREPGGGCGEEALRVVKMFPKWKPGKQRGRPVKVLYSLPVQFRLE